MLPPVKQYFAEMRFKPMPRYEQGVAPDRHHQPRREDAVHGLLDGSGNTPLSRLVGLMAEKKESLIGRLVHGMQVPEPSPIGRMFIQPRMLTTEGATVRLDDMIRLHFAIIAWGTDPSYCRTRRWCSGSGWARASSA